VEKVICSDIEDVKECEDLEDKVLCTYAKKYIYPNLESYSSSPKTTFICLWNVEKGCESKSLGRDSNDDESKGKASAVVVVIVLILVGVISLIITTIIIIIIIRRLKSRKNTVSKEYEMNNLCSLSDGDSLDLRKNQLTGLNL
jgi:hypothetical protein